ncbi:MAG: BamA/TamA family outer membrane protein [Elusimicrobia bacterium]|nr:BamA/TamA family outer membrane protein [Elusimicrobiota bacterium]
MNSAPSAALLIGLLLGAAAYSPAAVAAPPEGRTGGFADRLLKGAARTFTSDNQLFGEVHLPVIAVNPNSGITYGVLPVWLARNSRREISRIFAPMFTYNRTYGAAVSLNYHYYPSGEAKLRVILDRAEKCNSRAAVQYYDRALFDGRATLLIDTNYEADGGVKFYGVGPASTRGGEASVRLLETLARAELGLKLRGDFAVAAGWKVRRTEVQSGPFRTTATLDPKLRTTTSYSLPRLTLTRDTRDLPFTPSSGSLAELFAERSDAALGGSADFEHYGGQWRFYAPVSGNTVAVLHAQAEWSGGGEVPFTALSALGGPRSLRGYAEGRFQDRGSAFVNAEARWRVHTIDMLRSLTDFQIAPFLETGAVFPSPGRARARDFETVAGAAFRVVVKPVVVGRVEVGVGREGPEVYVGVDYPF